jgi:hypothetical protein
MIVAKLLLTVAVLGYSAVPARADLNATHATNPTWTPHARFHVVWQVGSYLGLGLLGLVLLWAPGGHDALRVNIVALIAVCVYGGFFGAFLACSRYGGRLADENGYPPATVRFRGRPRSVDLNLAGFTVLTLILAVAWATASTT